MKMDQNEQATIEHIEAMSTKAYRAFSDMSRSDLMERFTAAFAHDCHPKRPKDFIAKALARKFQENMYCKEGIKVPDSVRRITLMFWTQQDFRFLSEDGVREEKSSEVRRERVEEEVRTKKTVRDQHGIRSAIVRLARAVDEIDGRYRSIMEILVDKRELSYVALEKICRKKMGPGYNLSGALVLMQSRGMVEVEIPTTTVDVVSVKIIEEELLDVDELMSIITSKDSRKKTVLEDTDVFQTVGESSRGLCGQLASVST
jgi:hypothetical protein